jgi:hypothetical protein
MQAYPQIIDYNEAVQHPETVFIDPELRQARIKENALGLPMVLSGGFALTYMLLGISRRIAVRCFHRQIPAVEQKYAAISRSLRGLNSPYFVDFEFLGQGIRVRRQVYPVVKMDWAEGDILGLWLDRNHANAAELLRVRGEFAALAQFLEEQGISHGDIQNGNLVVSPRGIKLVDYDGVFVPGMATGEGSECGHKHFQHPERNTKHHGPGLDRFSFIALDLSLAALIEDPSLFRRYREGGETILFRANDFADPEHSEVFRILAGMPGLGNAAQRFARICSAPIDAVPTLRAFLVARGAPQTAPAPSHPAPRYPRAAGYIGTHPVLSAANFAVVMSHIGDRVELVGRVASVDSGLIKGGQRHGRPCLHLNFSRHWRNTVRLTIWSDGGDFPAALSRDWVGKWVSAVGLIGQPFVAGAFLVPRTQVGITLDDPSQLNFISLEQAEYRLAQPISAAPAVEDQLVPTIASGRSMPLHNDQIVAQMLASRGSAVTTTPAQRRVTAVARATSPPNVSGNVRSPLRTPGLVSGRQPASGMGALRRATRALMSGIVWSAIAIAMYALLRVLGSVGGPFDVVGELSSIITALLRGVVAVIGGAGLAGLGIVVPGPPGHEGLIFWVAALLRLTEIVTLLAATLAVVRILSAAHQVFARGGS